MTLVNNENLTDNSNEEYNFNCPADVEENIVDDFGGLEDDDLDEEDTSLFIGKITKIFITKNKVEESINKNSDEIIVENNKSKKKKFPKKFKKKHAISLIDIFMSIFLIGPLTIGHWRGTWNLMDYYNFLSTGWICFLIGTSLHWMFAILRNVLHRKLVEKWKFKSSFGRAAYGLLRLMYTYIFCLVCNMQWRGGWLTLDSLIGIHNTWIIGSVTFMCIVFLLILRSSRNLIAPPFIIVIDIPNLTFKFPTRFGSQVNTRHWALYVLDCAFSVGIIGTLVVFVWRGIFVLLDLHLLPNNRQHSAITSVIIGYIIVAITFCLQPTMRYTCGRMQGLSRLLVADAFLLLSFSGTVNVWRGIWAILDLWLLPSNIELSCWITHIGCFLFLGLLNCSNSVLVRGVYIDAEEEEGRCVVFPCHYLRLFFKIEREKKEARRRNIGTISRNFPHNNHEKDVDNGTLLNRTTIPTIIPANSENNV